MPPPLTTHRCLLTTPCNFLSRLLTTQCCLLTTPCSFLSRLLTTLCCLLTTQCCVQEDVFKKPPVRSRAAKSDDKTARAAKAKRKIGPQTGQPPSCWPDSCSSRLPLQHVTRLPSSQAGVPACINCPLHKSCRFACTPDPTPGADPACGSAPVRTDLLRSVLGACESCTHRHRTWP